MLSCTIQRFFLYIKKDWEDWGARRLYVTYTDPTNGIDKLNDHVKV